MNHWFLIYDDHCQICNTGVGKIRRLDKTGLVKLIPLSDPQLPFEFTMPSKVEMQNQMHLISPDRKVYKGADAIARVAEIFPESKLAGKIISFPLIRPIARLIYGLVAKNRLRLSKVVSSN